MNETTNYVVCDDVGGRHPFGIREDAVVFMKNTAYDVFERSIVDYDCIVVEETHERNYVNIVGKERDRLCLYDRILKSIWVESS